MASETPQVTRAEARRVREHLLAVIDQLAVDKQAQKAALAMPPPPRVKAWIDELAKTPSSHRDAPLTLLAYPVALGRQVDLTDRLELDRSTSAKLAGKLRHHKIAATKGALESSSFRHGGTHSRISKPEVGSLLTWATTADMSEIERAFMYLAAKVCSTARDIPAMPEIELPDLTFPRLAMFVEHLLDLPSQGAHAQYLFAGFLDAHIRATEEGLRVVTKTLFASDGSAKTAGDVQIVRGQADVKDAFEVSANHWTEKIEQAVSAVRQYDLRSVTIVAEGTPSPYELEEALRSWDLPPGAEICVVNLRAEMQSLIRRISSRRMRLEALKITHDHLAHKVSDTTAVNQFVDGLFGIGLARPAISGELLNNRPPDDLGE